MKQLLLAIFMLSLQPQDTLGVMFWNLENFFDYTDSGTSESDSEFSATGSRRWTKKRFYTKCRAVAKTVIYAGMPDIAAFAEIENSFVLRQIIYSTILRKSPYAFLHYDSPDPRGIDVGLLYRKDRLELKNSRPVRIPHLATRDILFAEFLFGETRFAICVNHHPSKYGGEKQSSGKREAAVRTLVSIADSLGSKMPLIACGDFNDTPDSWVFDCLSPEFEEAVGNLWPSARGTIKYSGNWELIDLFFVSPELLPCTRTDILDYPFLLTVDSAHSGLKPRRTYTGPAYRGGVSDHLPTMAKIVFE